MGNRINEEEEGERYEEKYYKIINKILRQQKSPSQWWLKFCCVSAIKASGKQEYFTYKLLVRACLLS